MDITIRMCVDFIRSFFRRLFGLNAIQDGQQHRAASKQDLKDGDVSSEIKKKWQIEVEELKKELVLEDTDLIKNMLAVTQDDDQDTDVQVTQDDDQDTDVQVTQDDDQDTDVQVTQDDDQDTDVQYYVSGVDISFVKEELVNACAALVVLSYPQLKVVYKDLRMVKLTAPYIPGYLGFRESGFAVELMETLKLTNPELVPHVIMVDGNGILHDHDFGSACHIGVALDMPCIGVAKSLFHTQGIGKDERHKQQIESMTKGGDTFELVTDTGKILGLALRTGDKSVNPVYVSPGNHISIESAAKLVHRCSLHRIPEPIRQADMLSREYLRNNYIPQTDIT